jgi:hypothetical protein
MITSIDKRQKIATVVFIFAMLAVGYFAGNAAYYSGVKSKMCQDAIAKRLIVDCSK